MPGQAEVAVLATVGENFGGATSPEARGIDPVPDEQGCHPKTQRGRRLHVCVGSGDGHRRVADRGDPGGEEAFRVPGEPTEVKFGLGHRTGRSLSREAGSFNEHSRSSSPAADQHPRRASLGPIEAELFEPDRIHGGLVEGSTDQVDWAVSNHGVDLGRGGTSQFVELKWLVAMKP